MSDFRRLYVYRIHNQVVLTAWRFQFIFSWSGWHRPYFARFGYPMQAILYVGFFGGSVAFDQTDFLGWGPQPPDLL